MQKEAVGDMKRVGAGDGNRTHVTSLGSWSSTIELHPRRLDSMPPKTDMQHRPAPSRKLETMTGDTILV